MSIKFEVLLDDECEKALNDLAFETYMSRGAVIRAALRLYQLNHLRVKEGYYIQYRQVGTNKIYPELNMMPVDVQMKFWDK